MSAARKGFYYKRLKEAGVPLERHFREYKLDELMEAHALAVQQGVLSEPTMAELADLEERAHRAKTRKAETEAARAPAPQPTAEEGLPPFELPDDPVPTTQNIPRATKPDPNELPGQRLNTKAPDDVIRVDEQGRQWLQEEVRKPAYPKPRGRRVLRYDDPGTVKQTVKTGDYTETFEVAGDPRNATPSQIKITLPSYQVGKYRDPRFPFTVIIYNDKTGFDREEVEKYWGGSELVPPGCKRTYVENVLCYDMRSVIRTIQAEYRQLQLSGQIK